MEEYSIPSLANYGKSGLCKALTVNTEHRIQDTGHLNVPEATGKTLTVQPIP